MSKFITIFYKLSECSSENSFTTLVNIMVRITVPTCNHAHRVDLKSYLNCLTSIVVTLNIISSYLRSKIRLSGVICPCVNYMFVIFYYGFMLDIHILVSHL